MMPTRGPRRDLIPTITPLTTEEEAWPYTDPGTRWEVPGTHMPVDWSGVMVDYTEPQVTHVLFGPDGEPLIELTDERSFGFARYLEENYEDQ